MGADSCLQLVGNLIAGWDHKWDTLATGFLAVGAAVLTVLTMFWIDARQNRRHRELMQHSLRAENLSLRPARLLASRAAFNSGEIFDLTLVKPERLVKGGESAPALLGIVNKMKGDLAEWLPAVHEAVKSEMIIGAKSLFDPAMAMTYETVQRLLFEFSRTNERFMASSGYLPEPELVAAYSAIADLADDLSHNLERFSGQLEALGQQYGAP